MTEYREELSDSIEVTKEYFEEVSEYTSYLVTCLEEFGKLGQMLERVLSDIEISSTNSGKPINPHWKAFNEAKALLNEIIYQDDDSWNYTEES